MITIDNIKEGAKFTNNIVTFEILSIQEKTDFGTLVKSKLVGGTQTYRDEINELVAFLNEEKTILIK